MISYFRGGVIALTFLATIGVANAQDIGPSKVSSVNLTGKSPSHGQGQTLQLSPAQKEMIFTLIRRTGANVKPPPSNTLIAIGAQLPPSAELYSLPDAAAAKLPTAKPYAYTIVQDTLVLVDPASREIVATELQ